MNRINRPQMIAIAAEAIPLESVNDLPMIRQIVNDLSDSYRKDGYNVPEWDQDRIIKAIQRRIRLME